MVAIAVLLGSFGFLPSSMAAPDYLKEVKPLLASRCFDCHGGLKQKGKLRVDTVAAMLERGVVNPGKPDDSELIYRISTGELEDRMPPEHEGALFREHEIKVIRDWITAGAKGPEDEKPEASPEDHWAFQRIERPEVPTIEDSEFKIRNPIDAFLAQKQIKHGLKPQSEAQRSLLLRRLYLDLVGLPPTPGQLESEKTFEVIVEELLASPHHGERWGRHWMDIWRYSDWYGLGEQLRYSQKHLWHWRDWIIDSVNADKGYDRMLQEMLAGDELDPGNHEVVAGTGFLARNYYLFNRTTWLDSTIEHSGKAFLGLTLNCAKCHDHKYDPISQVDYYRFRAFFEPHQIRLDAVPGESDFKKNGLPRAFDDQPGAPTPFHIRGNPSTPDESREIVPGVPELFASFASEPEPIELPVEEWAPGVRDYFQAGEIEKAEDELERAKEGLAKAQEQEGKPKTPKPESPAKLKAKPTEAGKGFSLIDDFERERSDLWKVVGTGWRYQGGDLVQLEPNREEQHVRSVKPHPGDFELEFRFRTTGGPTYKSVGIRFDLTDDGKNSHTVYASAHAPGPKVQIAHKVGGRTNYPAHAKVEMPINENTDYTLGVQVRGHLVNVSLNGEFLIAYHLPNRFPSGKIELMAFDATAEFDSIRVIPLDGGVKLKPPTGGMTKGGVKAPAATSIDLAKANLEKAQAYLQSLRARIAADNAAYRSQGDPEEAAKAAALAEKKYAVAAAKHEVLETSGGKVAEAKKKLASAKKALENPGSKYASLRGSFKALETPKHKEPQYAATYSRTSTGRRLALAEWITSRENPLTARVAANHIWTRHFGEPLVETVFDFGRSAPKPEHAELLDFLAIELIESGWSMKHLHRLMVTSEAWRRSSSNLDADPDTYAYDKTNRFYWRMNPRRMESQVVRDSLISHAGVIDLTMGGPSVDPGSNSLRRAIYFKHSRDQQSQLLATFDDAEILACYRRTESIVPQQALALTNSKVSIDMSQAMADKGAKDPETFIKSTFLRLLCREPTEAELEECATFLTNVPNRARLVQALFNHNDFLMIR